VVLPEVSSWDSVREFERVVADFAGAKYGIAVDSCTNALFLSLKYEKSQHVVDWFAVLPARTYVSAPMAVMHAGGWVKFTGLPWEGAYKLWPYQIIDSACRFRKGMYEGGLHCLSFQAKKRLPIGKGGMILTDDKDAVDWLTKARACGRNVNVPLAEDNIDMLGWNMVMTPEQASRGLFLMESMTFDDQDSHFDYPDLRKMEVFKTCA
jgi:dTDP-4-amino-4,6-dideoxygalactose transaminase